jgi:serine phosphatase RsbU (regulator of sigma subunit)/HAMP domain-containing protein
MWQRLKLSLVYQIIFIFIIIIIIPLVLFGTITLNYISKQAHILINERIDYTYNLVEKSLLDTIEQIKVNCNLLSGDLTFIGKLAEDSNAIDKSIEQKITELHATTIVVCDSSGKVISRKFKGEQSGFSTIIYDSLAIRGIAGESIMRVSSISSGGMLIEMMTPLKVFSKVKYVAFIGYKIDIDFLDNLKRTSGVELSIIKDGMFVITTLIDNKGDRMIGQPVEKSIWSRIKNKNKYQQDINIGGISHSAVFYPVFTREKEYIATIYIALPNEEFLKGTIRSRWALAILLVLAVGLASIAGYLLANEIVNPLRKFVKGSNEISKGNFEHKIDIVRQDEIGVLANEFNKMACDLKNVIEQLAERVNELSTLQELGKSVSSTLELDHLVEIITNSIMYGLGFDKAIFLFPDSKKEYIVEWKNPRKDNNKESIKLILSREDDILNKVYFEQQDLLINDVSKYKSPIISAFNLKKFLISPLVAGEQILSIVITDNSKSNKDITQSDVKVLSTFIHEASLALNNAKLYKDVGEKKRIEEELRIGQDIQLELLPKESPNISGLDIYGHTIPAKEIGGDYFDFIPGKDGHFAIIIGDVSGKGVPAGLIMIMTRSILHSLVTTKSSPREIILDTNKILAQDITHRFVTLLYLSWDSNRKIFKYSSAGHERLVIYRANKQKCDVKLSGGLALGVLPDIDEIVSENEISLDDGDMIFLYTDGATESMNQNNEMLGLKRLVSIIEKYGNESSQKMVENVFSEIKIFENGREQYDDITLVAIKRV